MSLRNQSGMGMIELLVTVSIFAILMAMGLGSIDSRRQDINTTVRKITADFRWARSRAVVSGDHFGFHVTGDNTYQIEHLEEANGNWDVATVSRSTTLPSHIVVTPATEVTELDNRGTVVYDDVANAVPVSWVVADTKFSAQRTLTLYPSGQIYVD